MAFAVADVVMVGIGAIAAGFMALNTVLAGGLAGGHKVWGKHAG